LIWNALRRDPRAIRDEANGMPNEEALKLLASLGCQPQEMGIFCRNTTVAVGLRGFFCRQSRNGAMSRKAAHIDKTDQAEERMTLIGYWYRSRPL
jgi:hypothetical protein